MTNQLVVSGKCDNLSHIMSGVEIAASLRSSQWHFLFYIKPHEKKHTIIYTLRITALDSLATNIQYYFFAFCGAGANAAGDGKYNRVNLH